MKDVFPTPVSIVFYFPVLPSQEDFKINRIISIALMA